MQQFSFIQYALLAIFGAGGVLLRYLLTQWLPKMYPNMYNVPIFLSNVLGAFLIGFLYKKYAEQTDTPIFVWLSIGFCGGLTTFSSFTLDIFVLLQQAKVGTACVYALGTALFSFFALWLGYSVSR